jgi:hypothetical protein
MRPNSSTVAQQIGVRAASIFQGSGHLRQLFEGPVVVDRLGELDHRRLQPGSIDVVRVEGHGAKDFSDQLCLGKKFFSIRTDQGFSTSLGTASSIPCGNSWVCGGSVPSGLPTSPLTSKPGGTHLLLASKPIGETLRYIHGSTTESIYQVPDTPRTSDSEQPELPVAHLPACVKEFEHGLRLGSGLPFEFGHFPCLGHRLRITQKQVQRPATPDMDSRLATVVQDVIVVAASFLKGVSEDGQAVEGSVVVDGLEPSGVDGW